MDQFSCIIRYIICRTKKLNNKEVAELVQNLSSGVPIATPVFDGASTDDITKMLGLAKLPNSGQTHLCNGQTGERFWLFERQEALCCSCHSLGIVDYYAPPSLRAAGSVDYYDSPPLPAAGSVDYYDPSKTRYHDYYDY